MPQSGFCQLLIDYVYVKSVSRHTNNHRANLYIHDNGILFLFHHLGQIHVTPNSPTIFRWASVSGMKCLLNMALLFTGILEQQTMLFIQMLFIGTVPNARYDFSRHAPVAR